jgi:antitoxin component YwqK of YwqJK toxin-antitoxin module
MNLRSELFEQNLRLFSRFVPTDLQSIREADTSAFEFVKTEPGKINLLKHGPAEDFLFHSPQEASVEARQALAHIDQGKTSSMVIFGLGLGYFFDELQAWLALSTDHTLVFVEDDWGVINCFLHTERAKLILTHPQVFFVCLPVDWAKSFSVCAVALEKARPFLIHLKNDWKYALLPIYSRQRLPDSNLLYQRLIQYLYMLLAVNREEFVNQEEDKNFYWNLIEAVDSFSAETLNESLAHMPFLICGAGPSLRQMPLFMTYISNEALLCAVGTGMNVLNSQHIEADLGIGLDSSQGEANRIKAQNSFLTPFFLSTCFAREGASYLHGPKLFVHYKNELKWRQKLLQALNMHNTLHVEQPGTASYLATEIALALDVATIGFVGVDLAFLEGKRYGTEENWLDGSRNLPNGSIRAIANDGRELSTSFEFLMESQLLAALAKKNPARHFFYASPEGLGIKTIPTVDLTTWWEAQGFIEWDVQNELHSAIITQPKLAVTYGDIQRVLSEWKIRLLDADIMLSQATPTPQKSLESHKAEPLLEFYAKAIDDRLEARKRYVNAVLQEKGAEIVSHELALLKEQKYRHLRLHLAEHINTISDVLVEVDARAKCNSLEVENHLGEEELTTIEDASSEEFYTEKPPQTGLWVRFYPDKRKKAHQSYKNGVLHGISQFFSPDGILLAEGVFQNGKPVGVMKQYALSGRLYSVQHWENGRKEGAQIFFYETGKIKSELSYQKGLLEGLVRLFYPNGNLKFQGQFHHGEREGVCHFFNFLGTLLEESHYLRGMFKGKYRTFYPNGRVHLEREYNSEGNFTEKEWSKEGELLSEGKEG